MAKVLLFGRLHDVAGWREMQVDPTPTSLSLLKAVLCRDNPRLAVALDGPGVRAAVNKIMVLGDVALPPAAEVAFMPPMSGG